MKRRADGRWAEVRDLIPPNDKCSEIVMPGIRYSTPQSQPKSSIPNTTNLVFEHVSINEVLVSC